MDSTLLEHYQGNQRSNHIDDINIRATKPLPDSSTENSQPAMKDVLVSLCHRHNQGLSLYSKPLYSGDLPVM